MPAELGKIERAPGRDLVTLERQFAVQDLNARYAEAIDDDRLEEWPEFFRPDGRYQITTAMPRRLPKRSWSSTAA